MESINRKADGTYEVVNYEITEEAIQAVPLVKPVGWTDELAEKLREAHRKLLRLVKNKPVGTEAFATYTTDIILVNEGIGSEYTVNIPQCTLPHIIMHNHPEGLTFSPRDIKSFVLREKSTMLSAIGNNGVVFVMQKAEQFNDEAFYRAFIDFEPSLQKYVVERNPQGYVEAVNHFLEEAEQYGLYFISAR